VLHEGRVKLVESRNMMSTAASVMTYPPAAIRAGADLREARERLGLSLDDVAANLRIRLRHLEALEEGRLSTLPGSAYALAFVRTYARYIGLDAEEMVRRFKAEADEFSRRTELVFPIPMPERGLPAGAIVLLGLVLAIGAYAAGGACRAKAACRPKRLPKSRSAWRRWPNRPCRRSPATQHQPPP
jgi:transcriptional regulator with XRE-family HTH domain